MDPKNENNAATPDKVEPIENHAAQEMGLWCIEPLWMHRAMNAIKSGLYSFDMAEGRREKTSFEMTSDGIAIISLTGPLMKRVSFFDMIFGGGIGTVELRSQIREAANDGSVKAILLLVDSPGGTVAGTMELADEISAAKHKKQVFAQVDDLAASAAFWVASQADKIFANKPAEIGSIGTFAVVFDDSEMFEKAGVKVHVISTGDMKGAFVEGTPVTEEMLQDLQAKVEALNDFFLEAVANGRKMSKKAVKAVADGRTFLAAKAEELGLIDGVQSLDDTMQFIRTKIAKAGNKSRAKAFNEQLGNINSAEPLK